MDLVSLARYGSTLVKPYSLSRWCEGQWAMGSGYMVLYIRKYIKVKYKGKRKKEKRGYILYKG